MRHGPPPIPEEELRAHFTRDGIPNGCDISMGSVEGSPPGTEEIGDRQLQNEDAQGRTADGSNPLQSVSHPGPRLKTSEVEAADQRSRDIGKCSKLKLPGLLKD